MLLDRLGKVWLPVVALTTTVLLWSGCSGIPGGGGGGVTSAPRLIEGTYESSPSTGQASQDYEVKTIMFSKDGTFKAYRTKKSLTEQKPDINGTYEVVDKDIVFKNPDKEEFEERGKMQSEDDTRFTWGLFAGDVFNKKQ